MLGKTLVSRFKISSELGHGGFGQTFIAEDMHLPGHPKCVIKQLKPMDTRPPVLEAARKLFDREAQALYKLGKHDRIPELKAHFEDENEFYLAQELVEGHVLSLEIVPGKRLSEFYTYELLEGVLQVLDFVHQQNVIHRDIKPSNLIRRSSDSKIVLIDFGAVKETSLQSLDPQGHASSTIVVGSIGYMPDEQANGRPKFASDIYATGIMCIHALTGVQPNNLPQDSKTGEIIWRNIVPSISPKLADFLDKMVCPYFLQRYQTAAEALEALQSILPSEISAATTIATTTIVSVKTVIPASLPETQSIAKPTSDLPETQSIAKPTSDLGETAQFVKTTQLPTEAFPKTEPVVTPILNLEEETNQLVKPAANKSVNSPETQSLFTATPSNPETEHMERSQAPTLSISDLRPKASGSEAETATTSESIPLQEHVPKKDKLPKETSRAATKSATKIPPTPLQPKKRLALVSLGFGMVATMSGIAGYMFWQQAEVDKLLTAKIEEIKSLKVAGKNQECINLAKEIPSISQYATTAQNLLKECQTATAIYTESNLRLTKAKELAQSDRLEEAIVTVSKISANSSAYTESQKLAEQWSVQLLAIAAKQYEQGKLKEAIALTKVIPTNSPAGKKVQELTANWQREWNADSEAVHAAKNAREQGDWNKVVAESTKVKTSYWMQEIAPLVQEANKALSPDPTPTQREASPDPIPAPTSQPKPEASPDLDLPPIRRGN